MSKEMVVENPAPKKKFAVIFGYNGSQYQGLQINKDANTIEGTLFKVFGELKLISESNLESLQKVSWTRAARTDKGVHALGQVVSAKLCLSPLKMTTHIEDINKALPSDIKIFDIIRVRKKFNSKLQCYGRKYCYTFPMSGLHDKQDLKALNKLLQSYVGTKAYHNFTKRVAPNDPARFRYIRSCVATKVEKDNQEYVFVSIEGQSFLLNQIRKMVGLVILITLTGSSMDLIEKAFGDEPFETPMAPAEGLLLQACLFPKYNKGCVSFDNSDNFINVDTDRRRPIQFEVGQVKDSVESFYKSIILPVIIEKETKDKVFSEWVKEEMTKEFPRIHQKRKGEYSDYDNYKQKKKASKEMFIESKKTREEK